MSAKCKIPDGYVLLPINPTKELLDIIWYEFFPEDWETGKKLQLELGLDVIFPKTEVEIAAGQYKRLVDKLKEMEKDNEFIL